jgi:hypothetical protein
MVSMDTHSSHQHNKHLFKFVSTVLLLLISICFLTGKTLDFRKTPFDLRTLPEGSLLTFRAVPYWIHQEIKIGQLENFNLPKIGAFGGHHIQYFSSKAFKEKEDISFFNYFMQGLTLPQLKDFIINEGEIGRLPDLILFQIVNPRIRGGSFLINRKPVMSEEKFSQRNQQEFFQEMWEKGRNSFLNFQYKIDWAQVTSSIIPGKAKYIFDPQICGSLAVPDFGSVFKNMLPGFLKRQFSEVAFFRHACSLKYLSAYSSDGSNFPLDNRLLKKQLPQEGILQTKDVEIIANYLKAIHRAVEKAGKKIVFFTHPVNKSDHHGQSDQVLSKSIALCDELIILEKRFDGYGPDYFVGDDNHPGSKFYLELVEDLKKRNLLL